MMRERLSALRWLMHEERLSAYHVGSADPHQSEYVPTCWRRRAWLSGFTGSAGTVVVTRGKAGLWTDGRYFVQAEEELKGSGITLFREGIPGTPKWSAWLKGELKGGGRLGIDSSLVTVREAEDLERDLAVSGIEIAWLQENLVDRLWTNRPPLPQGKVLCHPLKYTGRRSSEKLEKVRSEMEEHNTRALVLSRLDCIAWLFNIRGSDVPFNPVALAYAVITPDEALLFSADQSPPSLSRHVGGKIRVLPYGSFEAHLAELGQSGLNIWLDPGSANRRIEFLAGPNVLLRESPIPRLKAVKSRKEIRGAEAAHVRDGAALAYFFEWLESAVPKGRVTETGAAEKLTEFRARQDLFRGPSFETIAAYNGHGAIVHYRSTPATDAPLKPEGLLLLDSGGQYLDGTTDVTRTVALGAPKPEQRRHFTLVLKGLIRISRTAFPPGTKGGQLDVLARQPLWAERLDYQHGTGHGIGSYLNVHEGPQSISPTKGSEAALETGMILSLEPGYYREGRYGIRIENLAHIVPAGGEFLRFETLTLFPIDTRLIDETLLTEEESGWLNDYHRRVWQTLSPELDGGARRWLENALRPP